MSEHTERELIRVLRDIEVALAVIAKCAVIRIVTDAPSSDAGKRQADILVKMVQRTEAAGKARVL